MAALDEATRVARISELQAALSAGPSGLEVRRPAWLFRTTHWDAEYETGDYIASGGQADVYYAWRKGMRATGAPPTCVLKVARTRFDEVAPEVHAQHVRRNRELVMWEAAVLTLVSYGAPSIRDNLLHAEAVYDVRTDKGELVALVLPRLHNFVVDSRGAGTRESVCARIVRDVVHGLRSLHALQMVHLDFKLDHIMLDPSSGRLKVIDLGLSRLCRIADTAAPIPEPVADIRLGFTGTLSPAQPAPASASYGRSSSARAATPASPVADAADAEDGTLNPALLPDDEDDDEGADAAADGEEGGGGEEEEEEEGAQGEDGSAWLKTPERGTRRGSRARAVPQSPLGLLRRVVTGPSGGDDSAARKSRAPRYPFSSFSRPSNLCPGGSDYYLAPESMRGEADAPRVAYFSYANDAFALGVALCRMLLPEAEGRHVGSQADGSVRLPSDMALQALSAECRDLVKGLLDADPNRRLSLDLVLEHPWINRALLRFPHRAGTGEALGRLQRRLSRAIGRAFQCPLEQLLSQSPLRRSSSADSVSATPSSGGAGGAGGSGSVLGKSCWVELEDQVFRESALRICDCRDRSGPFFACRCARHASRAASAMSLDERQFARVVERLGLGWEGVHVERLFRAFKRSHERCVTWPELQAGLGMLLAPSCHASLVFRMYCHDPSSAEPVVRLQTVRAALDQLDGEPEVAGRQAVFARTKQDALVLFPSGDGDAETVQLTETQFHERVERHPFALRALLFPTRLVHEDLSRDDAIHDFFAQAIALCVEVFLVAPRGYYTLLFFLALLVPCLDDRFHTRITAALDAVVARLASFLPGGLPHLSAPSAGGDSSTDDTDLAIWAVLGLALALVAFVQWRSS